MIYCVQADMPRSAPHVYISEIFTLIATPLWRLRWAKLGQLCSLCPHLP